MFKKIVLNEKNIFRIILSAGILLFLFELAVLVVYRETWFDEMNYLWKSYLIMKGELVPFQNAILEYPPLFVPFYGLSQIAFGPSFYAGRILSCVFFAAAMLLGFLTAKRLSEKWAALMFLFFILSNFYLISVYTSATLYSLSLLLLVSLVFLETLNLSLAKKMIFAGMILGLLALARTNLAVLIIPYLTYLIFLRVPAKKIIIFFGFWLSMLIIGYWPVLSPNFELGLSVVFQPFANFGPMRAIAGRAIGKPDLAEFLTTLTLFLKEYYSILLLFFSFAFLAFLKNKGKLADFARANPAFFLASFAGMFLMLIHFFYWRFEAKLEYANYFIPLLVLGFVWVWEKYLKGNSAVLALMVCAILFNFGVNLYPAGVISNPNEETDLERVRRGAQFIKENIPQDAGVLAFDNSIFHLFLADRRIRPELLNRNFLFAPEVPREDAQKTKFYNFEMLKEWVGQTDYLALNEENWRTSFIRYADESGKKRVEELEKILSDSFEFVAAARNVYPRKYTEGNDGGTLKLYRRKAAK